MAWLKRRPRTTKPCPTCQRGTVIDLLSGFCPACIARVLSTVARETRIGYRA